MSADRMTTNARAMGGDILSAAGVAAAVGWGVLALGGLGWAFSLSIAAVVLLGGMFFSRRGMIKTFCGGCFFLLGCTLAYYFCDIILFGGDDFSIAAVAGGVALGGAMVALEKRSPIGTALVALLLFYGAGGIVSRALISNGNVCWIYEPHEGGEGRLVAAEPCYVVENHDGDIQIAPGGHFGVLPLHPNTSHAGKKAGPYRIIGVLEIGGTVYGVGEGRFAWLDYSMVSPGGGGGVGVVRNPLIPSI